MVKKVNKVLVVLLVLAAALLIFAQNRVSAQEPGVTPLTEEQIQQVLEKANQKLAERLFVFSQYNVKIESNIRFNENVSENQFNVYSPRLGNDVIGYITNCIEGIRNYVVQTLVDPQHVVSISQPGVATPTVYGFTDTREDGVNTFPLPDGLSTVEHTIVIPEEFGGQVWRITISDITSDCDDCEPPVDCNETPNHPECGGEEPECEEGSTDPNCVPEEPTCDDNSDIEGCQPPIRQCPEGMIENGYGCVQPPTDFCPNMPGLQDNWDGMYRDAEGNCHTQPSWTYCDMPNPAALRGWYYLNEVRPENAVHIGENVSIALGFNNNPDLSFVHRLLDAQGNVVFSFVQLKNSANSWENCAPAAEEVGPAFTCPDLAVHTAVMPIPLEDQRPNGPKTQMDIVRTVTPYYLEGAPVNLSNDPLHDDFDSSLNKERTLVTFTKSLRTVSDIYIASTDGLTLPAKKLVEGQNSSWSVTGLLAYENIGKVFVISPHVPEFGIEFDLIIEIPMATNPIWHPNGYEVTVEMNNGRWLYNVYTGEREQIDEANGTYFDWDHNGRRFVVVENLSSNIIIWDMEFQQRTVIGIGREPVFSSNGQFIAYSADDAEGNSQIYVYDVYSGETHQETDNVFDNRAPQWLCANTLLYTSVEFAEENQNRRDVIEQQFVRGVSDAPHYRLTVENNNIQVRSEPGVDVHREENY